MKNKTGLKIGDKLYHKMYNEVVTIADFLDNFDGKSVSSKDSKCVVFKFGKEDKIDQDRWKYLRKIKEKL
jgi:hypothetical protein